MAFRFKRKESVEKAIQRIAQERLACAIKQSDSGDELEAVHRVRMEIKKVRGILRLVRKASRDSFYKRQTDLLRQTAGLLGPVRDAHVTEKALKDLIDRFKGQLPQQPFKKVRHALQERRQEVTKEFARKSSARQVANNLQKVLRGFRPLHLCAKGWDSLSPGLKWSYTCGRNSKAASVKSTSPETLHEWRKRVKDLWYQVRLLRQVWPEQLCATASELKELSDLLGDDHDLVMLHQALQQIHGNKNEVEVLCGLIHQRQQELRSAALMLGARFYAQKPAVFVNRLGQYWTIWRGQKRKLTRKARVSVI